MESLSKKKVRKDKVSSEPRKRKYKKAIISDTARVTGIEDEERQEAKLRVSVKRDWDGTQIYFPSSTKGYKRRWENLVGWSVFKCR